MKLGHLITSVSQLSDEELMERLRQVRHRREVARPVAAKKAERAVKKTSTKAAKAIDKSLDSMSPEEKQALLAALLSED